MHAAHKHYGLHVGALRRQGGAFVGVIADDQRNIILLALSKNRGNVLRQDPAINDGPDCFSLTCFQ